jgi:riboflavin transporter FmnP
MHVIAQVYIVNNMLLFQPCTEFLSTDFVRLPVITTILVL